MSGSLTESHNIRTTLQCLVLLSVVYTLPSVMCLSVKILHGLICQGTKDMLRIKLSMNMLLIKMQRNYVSVTFPKIVILHLNFTSE